jgi:hypothetical protein
MTPEHLLLVVSTAATWVMVGLILFVHFVHYPLFTHFRPDQFAEAMPAHQRRTAAVVGPLTLT